MASANTQTRFEERMKERQSAIAKANTEGTGGTVSSTTQTRFAERIKDRRSKFEGKYTVDDNFINTFFTDAQNYLDIVNRDMGSIGYSTIGSIYDSQSESVKDLTSRFAAIQAYMRNNRNNYDPETYSSFMLQLNDFGKAMHSYHNYFYNTDKYYSQWETEDEYNWWQDHGTAERRQQWHKNQQSQLDKLKSEKEAETSRWNEMLESYDPESYEFQEASMNYYNRQKEIDDQIAAVESEIRNYQRGNYSEEGYYYGSKTIDDYYEITERPDFDVTSANRDYVNPTREELWEYDTSGSEGTVALGYGGSYDEEGNILDINGNIVRYAKGPEVVDKLGMFLSAGEEGVQEAYNQLSINSGNYTDTWANIMQEGDVNGWKYLEDTEIGIYYALLDDSQEAAYKFLSDMIPELTRRETMAKKAYIEEAPVLEQILLNAASIPMNVIGGGVAFIDDAINMIQGEEINPYSRAHSMQNTANFIREDTARDINNLTGNVALPWVGTTFGDVYQSIMSAGDSLFGTVLGGNAYGVLMGMGAASSEMKKLYEQGASMEQMAAGGILAGAAEMVFEKLSIESLINLKDAKSVSQVIKNLLIQGGIEASEEVATEIANTITNVIVMGEQSDWVDVNTFAKNVVNAGIGGFISGGFSGGLSSAASYGQYNQNAKNAGKEIMKAEGGVDALKSLAMEVSGADSKLAKQANKVTGETYTGDGLIGKAVAAAKNNKSQRDVGKLDDSVRTEVAKQNQADLAKSIEAVGISSKSANNIAGAVMAQLNGEELSKVQKAALDIFKSNEKVQEAISGILENADSTVSKRNLNLDTYSLGINMGVGIAPNASRTSPAQAGEENASSEGNLSSKAKVISEGSYEVSGDGSTTIAGQNVTLDGFRKTDDGAVVIATTDNQTADPSEVTYSNKGQALVYENYAHIETTTNNPVIANMGLDTRSALAKAYDPASGVDAKMYVLAANQAYWYGFNGMSMTEKTLPANTLVNDIAKEQRDLAYSLGRKAGKAAAETQSAGIQAAYEKAVEKLGGKEAAKAVAKRNKGEVVLEDNIKQSSLTKQQRGSLQLAKVVAEATGVNVHIYHGTKEYGKYNTTTGEVWLNVNAMFTGQSMMAFTLGHELVHMAKQWSPADFKEFADYLLEKYGEKGVSVEALIQAQIANAKDNGYELNEQEAYEEVIADACQRMLLDSNAVQKMAAYKAQNPSRWQQIIDAIKEFIDKIRSLFAGAEPDSTEAALYKEFDDAIKENLEEKFVKMVMDAGEHMSTIRNAFGKGTVVEVNENGEFTLAKGEDSNGATKFLYNDYTWEKGGRETLTAALKAEGFSQEDIGAALTIMDGKHKLVTELAKKFPEQDRINNVTITTDLKDGHSVLSALVSNGDYPVNIDLLMVCKKRKAYQRVINRLCETGMIQQATVDALAIAEINKILGKYGFETACLGCFVESRRLRIQEWAQTIVKEWNAEVKKRNPKAKAFGFGKGEAKLTQDEVMQLIGELESGGEKNDQGNLNLGQGSAVKRMGVLLDKVPSLRRTLAIEDLITPDGLSSLRRFDSNLFSMVKSRYGSNSPKFVQEFNPYNHELAKYGKVPSEYKSLREYLYAIGGARMQSFSDFIVENWFDYCQIVADLAARKLPMHTYTKEIALVKLFGLTGIKINMSLIPDIDRSLGKDYAGLTRNANGELELIWADKDRFKATGGKSYMQSINFADAVALQNDPRYSGNIGTIAVGISDKHILMMLDDNRIRMIIPYHSSGMNPIFADLMGTSYYKDYTNFQNTTVKQIYNSKGQKVSLKLDKTQTGKLTSGFQFNEVLQELGDARAAAQAYKEWCADASKHTITIKGETYTAELTPKFDDFSDHENYYKLLEDFNTYDCISEQAAPQGDVQQNYPEDFDKILVDELKSQEGHRQKQAANQAFDKAMGEIESYLKSHTKADTVFYAEQHGVKISAKDKKLGAEDKKKLADLRKGMKFKMPRVYTDAVEKFGTTTDFAEAGFILPSGELLKFTDDKHKGERQYDHRAIGLVYGVDVDLNVHRGYNKESNKHLDDFVEKGGIRFDPGSLEFNFDAMMQMSKNVPLTKEQEQAIREFVEWKKQREEMYNPDEDPFSMYRGPLALRIDFGDTSGVALSADRGALGIPQLTYEGGQINASRIIADIRHYYQTGEIRKPSSVAQFRYKMPKNQKSPTYEELIGKKPIKVIDIGKNDEGLSYAELKEIALENAEKNKVFEVPHPNRDTKVLIFLTQKSFTHAFSNLTKDFGEDTILAMDHISEIIHEAVLTHIAPPKNPRKAEARVFTFFAAIESKRGTEPVKLTVKEYVGQKLSEIPVNIRKYFEENGAQETHNRLYDAEVLEVIAVESAKKEPGASASVANRKRLGAKGTPNSTIKIADLLGLVNGEERKYIPLPAGTDAGYHAGDLGKAEFLHNQGYGRDTGHFGTGTYFVGSKELIENDRTYASRPHHAVNFGNYNLYKIRNDDDGYKLHRSLRVIDGGFSQDFLDAAVADKFAVSELGHNARRLIEKYDTQEWDEELEMFLSKDYIGSAIRAYTEVANSNGLDIQSYDEWLTEQSGEVVLQSDPDYAYYKSDYLDYLKDIINEADADRNRGYSKFREAYFDLWLRFGIRGKNIKEALQKTLDHQNSFSDSDIRAMSKENGVDSLATVFMKSMGYEGIDVRGTGLDNVGYGSVIYDLNPSSVIYKTPNSKGMSSRQLLANAFDDLAQTPNERKLMAEYRNNITKVEEVQERLKKLRGEIRMLTNANGDKNKIATMNKTAADLADLIDKYDRKLLELEASKPLRDVLARAKSAAYQEAKKRSEETMKEYRQQVSERFDRGVEGRRKTEMRHKIQNVVKELNDLLLNESKKRHVPDNLKKAVAGALSIVNMDTVDAEDRAAKYAALIAKEQAKAAPDQDKIDSYTMTMENILRQGEKLGQRLKELRDAYEEIQNSDDPDIANAYDPVIAGAMKELSQTIGNTSIRNMSLDQLSDVYDMYRMVLTRVRDANKALLENIKESIGNLASKVIGEVRITGGDHKYRAAILDPARKFLWDNMKPVYAMEWIGSSTLTKVFNNVRAGEDTWAKDVTEAREYYLEKSKKYGYDSWDFEKKYRFESASGIEFDLTLEQILSLYAYSKRNQAHDHLRLGGFVFDSNIESYKDKDSKILKYKVNTADAHQITPEILAAITGKLNKDQMDFVDEMQEYLSSVMGAKGNEVTSKMYGVKLFKEKFYFPLKSAKQFMFEQNEVSGEVKIKNSGFTNKVVAKANNPVILSNFMDVWSGHVNDMSMYHAFTLPLEDFNRVFNYNSPKQEGQPPVSVKGTIQGAYSPAAVHYVKNLITDLNGGARTDSTTGFINKMMGLFKKGSVFASMSVVVQQPSAIARAAALVDTKYFIGPKVDHKRHKALWAEVKQYAPVAVIKEMGYFDTNMGKSTQDFILAKEYDGFKDKMKALVNDSGYRDEVLSKAPALADEIAWCGIWEAVKRETKAKYPGLDANGEPFLKLAGSRFTEVITKTQVYDSVLSRSGNMRSKDTGMKMATAFMAEPTTSINMIADALLQGKRGNKKYARKAIGAVIASQILNSILVSFVYAGRDDDDDETYLEKYIGTFTGEMLDSLNPAGYIPFIKDIMSIVQGYDVERSDMAVISDLWKAWENLGKDTVSPYRKVEGFVGSIAQIFGLPVKNIMRDVRGIWQTIDSFVNGQKTTGAGIGYAVKSALPELIGGGDVSKDEQLYRATLSGNQAHLARVKDRYANEKAVNSGMRSAIKEHYLAGDIDSDTAIKYMVSYCGDDEDEAFWKVEEWRHDQKFEEDFGKYNEFYDAVQTGKNLKTIIQKYTDNGVTTGTLKAQITEHFKEQYIKMSTAEKANIKGYLLNAFTILGDDRKDAEGKLSAWEFEAKNGFNYENRRELFLSGEITGDQVREAVMTFGGKTAEEADKEVELLLFEAEYGFAYSEKEDLYKSGEITASELKHILMTAGGETAEEADLQIQAYDWETQGYEKVTPAAVRDYNEYCAAANVPKDIYLHIRSFSNNTGNDVDEATGKTIYYSAMKKVIAEIDAQYGLTAAQKDAIARSLGWAEKNIKKYKTW